MLMPTHPQDVLIARLKSAHWVIHRPKVISAEVCSSITMFLTHSSVKSFHKIGNAGTWGLLPLANSEICYPRKWVRISASKKDLIGINIRPCLEKLDGSTVVEATRCAALVSLKALLCGIALRKTANGKVYCPSVSSWWVLKSCLSENIKWNRYRYQYRYWNWNCSTRSCRVTY